MTRIKLIEERLQQAFAPVFLNVIDESYKHKGHAGALTGRGHFKIELQADCFSECSPVQSHRLIYQALGSLMETDIHALSIELKRPD